MEKRIASILFADIKNSSNIKDDNKKELMYNEFAKIQQNVLDKNDHFYHNTYGDGLVICSYDYEDLARIALNLRDEFKKCNWKKLGLPKLEIRIAVNLERISIKEERGEVVNIVGSALDKTSRIEPITAPNKVFASKKFCDYLREENPNMQMIPVGTKKLAKEYGEMELFELLWDYEKNNQIINSDLNIPMPKIKKIFSDLEKKEYLQTSLQEIFTYFKHATNKLEAEYPSIRTETKEVSNYKFICKIFIKGIEKRKCKIWFDTNSFMSGQDICYSENFSTINDDNSMNDWLSIKNEGFEISFLASRNWYGEIENNILHDKDFWNTDDAALYFWLKFIEFLEIESHIL